LYFLRLGAFGFGGPVALASYIRRDLVERRRWLSEEDYGEGLAIATACPGPLAYQLGIYCGYILHKITGAVTVALAFAFVPFLIVLSGAFFYVKFAGNSQIRGLFYGVSPVIVALIAKACWNLGVKTIGKDKLALLFAIAACAITVNFQRELTVVFLAAGFLGIFLFAKPAGHPEASTAVRPTSVTLRSFVPQLAVLAVVLASSSITLKLFLFFLKTGLLVFGSGLVIVPFLKTYLVNQYGWLNERQFLDAVAVGMITPGPVVITATFVGYLLGGFSGATAATVGIFLPSLFFTVVGTPWLRRNRANARLRGFVRGITVAVVGVLVGTSYLVGKTAIGDWLTLALGVGALAISLTFKRVPDALLVAAGAICGLIAYPVLQPAWLMK
jgi:chromate transporter